MADKIIIEIFKNKNADEFTSSLSDKDSRLNVGSAAAYTGALAAALLVRAASITSAAVEKNERVEYILRNSGTMRTYMVHLIDEDVKSRSPLSRAIKEGDERSIEAARQSAACISNEIVNMMGQLLEFADELAALAPADAFEYLGESAELAMGAIKSCMVYLISMADKCSDETYRFVTHRENEITLDNCNKTYESIKAKVKAEI